MHKTERKFHQFLSVFLSFCMIFALTVGNYGDYVRADSDDENEGKSTASYDCVWFGQYPQSEVPQGSELYQTLSGLTESSWNSCRETLYQENDQEMALFCVRTHQMAGFIQRGWKGSAACGSGSGQRTVWREQLEQLPAAEMAEYRGKYQ